MINKKSSGFSYIEVLVAMALFVIILAPILPALTQALSNHVYAVSRREAQGLASDLVLSVRLAPENAAHLVSQMAARNDAFIFRVSLAPFGEGSRYYTVGDESLIPPVGPSYFHTSYGDLFEEGMFVIAEVFDSNGNLAGMSVGKAN